MADRKKIRAFAVKWRGKFRDGKMTYPELEINSMGEECEALGFKMDTGHGFKDKYGEGTNTFKGLAKVIDHVTDIPLLGSGIYSEWRFFTHWAYDPRKILSPENRAWFILALDRLAQLSEESLLSFQGKLEKIRLRVNNCPYGPMPGPNKEIKQDLTLRADGSGCLLGYRLEDNEEEGKPGRRKDFKIEREGADRLFSSLGAYFSKAYLEAIAYDVGSWQLELTNTQGRTYEYWGPLYGSLEYEGVNLSDLVRETLAMDDLYAFDGKTRLNVVNKIALDYSRTRKPADGEEAPLEYRECLVVDRKEGTLTHVKKMGKACKISHQYENKEGIKDLLDSFHPDYLFARVEGNPYGVVDWLKESRTYKLTVDYERGPQRVLEGTYDKRALPEDFPSFVESIMDFIQFFDQEEALDPRVYGKVRRRKSDYIFCSVLFKGGGKTYYYLTEDDSIDPGDFVFVPAGKDNHRELVKVVALDYFTSENAPLDPKKTKKVLRKYRPGDEESPWELWGFKGK